MIHLYTATSHPLEYSAHAYVPFNCNKRVGKLSLTTWLNPESTPPGRYCRPPVVYTTAEQKNESMRVEKSIGVVKSAFGSDIYS